ncbi:sensor histidine kinase [Halobellus rufus]|uniref:sensor histidine kinase n=1 Tax=Halobellus rufus TaxID=1448860 RepID=UPI000679800B|nr:PAS domain-containing sensor histidine kinase [Halobellus rufus]
MHVFAAAADDALEALVDGIGDAVVVRDAASGEVVAVNDAVESVFGFVPDFDVALDDAYAADPTRAAEARENAMQGADGSTPATFRWRVERPDGTSFWAESTVSTTEVGDREFVVSVVRDVTERTERERDLERLAEILTHDLKSPLNAAKAQVDILRSEAEGGEEFLDRLERVHDRMGSIVADVRALVDGSRSRGLTLDSLDLNRVVTDAWEAVGGCGDEIEPSWCGDTGASLVVDGDLGTVVADERRLRRLFENLFENALRHGGADADCVTVTVSPTPTGVAVADDGVGVPMADRERVFEYGYTTADGGTGFGLNIVAATAESHGWDVAVCDSEAGGACFEISGMRGSGE